MLGLSKEACDTVLDLRKRFEHLFFVPLHGDEIILRPLSILETQVLSGADSFPDVLVDDWTVRQAVVYHSRSVDWLLNEAPAGLVPTIAAMVARISLPQSDKDLITRIEDKRKDLDTVQSVMESLICKAFKILPRQVREMPLDEQIEHVVLAEEILGEKLQTVTNKKGKAPPVPPGYRSTGPNYLSPEMADLPDFDGDNEVLSNL